MIHVLSRRPRRFRPSLEILESWVSVANLYGIVAATLARGGVIEIAAKEQSAPSPVRDHAAAKVALPTNSGSERSELTNLNGKRVPDQTDSGASSSEPIVGSRVISKPVEEAAAMSPWADAAAVSRDPAESMMADLASASTMVSQAHSAAGGTISASAPVVSSPPTSSGNVGAPGGPAAAAIAASSASSASASLGAAVTQAMALGSRSPAISPPPVQGSNGHAAAGGPVSAHPNSGGPGGGGDTPNEPPIISAKGTGFILQSTGPGYYNITNPVPVGAIMALQSLSPYQDPDGAITSYSWSGGSQFSGYYSTVPTAAPPQAQSAPQAPVTTNPSYSFIVDTPLEPYTISLTVNYNGDGSGTSVVTFSPDEPTGSLAVQQVGTQTFGAAQVILDPRIQISATTSVDQYTPGQFMFMQIATSVYVQYTLPNPPPNGTSMYLMNSAAFPGFDGPLYDSTGITAYWYTYQNNPVYAGWTLPSGSGASMPATGQAAPYMQDGPNYTAANGNDLQVSYAANFSTYLMYQPSIQGVWIALSQINWVWLEVATNNGGVWGGTTTKQPAPTGPTAPTGAAAFPSWVNTSVNFVNQAFIPGP